MCHFVHRTIADSLSFPTLRNTAVIQVIVFHPISWRFSTLRITTVREGAVLENTEWSIDIFARERGGESAGRKEDWERDGAFVV